MITPFLDGKRPSWRKVAHRFARKALPDHVVEKIHIGLQDFEKHPPVLIYQMGKVGSSTVYKSLQEARLPNPVYHVHFLSREGIARSEKGYEDTDRARAKHLRISKCLRKKLDGKNSGRWFIITGVRDPIGRFVSSFFQIADRYYPAAVDANGRILEEKAIEVLHQELAAFDEATDYACTWFDKELKEVFGIDVFQEPFDREKGYTILDHPAARVLILRQEDLTQNFTPALAAFIPTPQPIAMAKSNVGAKKEYSQEYEYVKQHIKIPADVCERIYSSRYVRHFYDEEMIARFTARWSDRAS